MSSQSLVRIDSQTLQAWLACGDTVLIDVRACGYIDSMGIGALVRAARRERQGRIVVLCAPSGAVRKVIDAVGLDALVPVLESREDALDTLAAARRAD